MNDLLREGRLAAQSRSSHGALVEALGSAIVAGRYPPGSPLPRDEELSRQYGVSRTVLRETMKTLAAKGLVTARPKVGTTVCPVHDWNLLDAEVLGWQLNNAPGQAFFNQLFEMRLSFEPFAAGLAALRAQPADIEIMRASVARMATTDDPYVFADADLDLHKAVVNAAGNAFMHSMVAVIRAALLTALRLSSPAAHPVSRTDIADRHARIVDAIASRDVAAAEAAMRDVIDQGRIRIEVAAVAADNS